MERISFSNKKLKMNEHKNMVLYNIWLSKTNAKKLEDAMADDEIGDCFAVLKVAIKDGEISRR